MRGFFSIITIQTPGVRGKSVVETIGWSLESDGWSRKSFVGQREILSKSFNFLSEETIFQKLSRYS